MNKSKLEEATRNATADLLRHNKVIVSLDKKIAVGERWIGRKKTHANKSYYYARLPCSQRVFIAYRKSRADHSHLNESQIFSLADWDYQECAGRRDVYGQRRGGTGPKDLPYVLVANSNLLPERHFYSRGDNHDVLPATYITRAPTTEWPELDVQRGPYLKAVQERQNKDSLLRRYRANYSQTSGELERLQIQFTNSQGTIDACKRAGLL